VTDTDVELVKRRNRIDEVIAGHGVQLRRAGDRLAGRCPFHDDRSPSLAVYTRTQSFYCFGCGASGDVIDFVRRMEGVGFREALDRLAGSASRSAAPLRASRKVPRGLSLDDRLILTAASELYHETLLHSPGVLAYLDERGVPLWLARQLRVGYSDGRHLVAYLRRRRLSLRRAAEMGLLYRSDDETLAGRVVIPELRSGHCTWMVGRALDDREPRYRGLSLPRPLLGYEQVRGRGRVFLTEGPFDWLTLLGWGLPACALLGTHPGRETLRLLDDAWSVFLVLDGDNAGLQATRELAAVLGERARVVELPAGVKDVNELGARLDGRDEFFRLLQDTEHLVRDAVAID